MKPIETPDGQFVDGTRRVPGTPVAAKWLNSIQNEIINVIKKAKLELSDDLQLDEAINLIIDNKINLNNDIIIVSAGNISQTVIQGDGKSKIWLLGYHASHPGVGGGQLLIDHSDSAVDDVRVFLSKNGIKLKRSGSYLSPYDAGAIGDGSADDSAAMLKYTRTVDVVNIPRGTFNLVGNIFDVPVNFEIGGKIKVLPGNRVTFRHDVDSPAQKIFEGDGEIVFSVGPNGGEQTRQCHASWWGISPGLALGDQSPLINKALSAYGDLREGVLYFDVGAYGLNSTVSVPRGVEIRGQGIRKTVFFPYTDGWPVFKTKNTAVHFRDIQFETPKKENAGFPPVLMRKSPYIEIWNSAAQVERVMFANSEYPIKVWAEGCNIKDVEFDINGINPSLGSSLISIHNRYCTVDGVSIKLGRTNAASNIIYIGASEYIDGISVRNIDTVASSRLILINATHGSVGNVNISNINQYGTEGSPPEEAIKAEVGPGKYIAGLNISNININRYPLNGMLFDVRNGGQLVDVNIGMVSILGSPISGTGIEFRIEDGPEGMIRRVNIANTVSIVRGRLVVIPQDSRVNVVNNQSSIVS